MSQPAGEADRPMVDPTHASTPSLSSDPPRRPARTAGTCLVAVLALTALGVPLGLLWYVLAPRVPVIRTADGAVLAEPQPEQFIAADGWFSLLGLGFGVLAAIGTWWVLRRVRGPIGLLVVVAGSVGAALAAWQLGRRIGLAGYHRLLETAAVGQTLDKPADLRAGGFEWVLGGLPTLQGDVLVPAFGAAVTYTLLAGWSRWPSLNPEPEPQPWSVQPWPPLPDAGAVPAVPLNGSAHPPVPLSWGSVEPPVPPAAPAPPGPDAGEPPRG